MTPLLTTFLISTGSAVLLVLLYLIEERKGQRVLLRRPRALFDLGLFKLNAALGWLAARFGASTLRRWLHVSIHGVLRALLLVVEGLSYVLRRLQRTNRKLADSLSAADGEGGLSDVREHVDQYKLSPEEKTKKRRELLE